jgi:hypothetical protein
MGIAYTIQLPEESREKLEALGRLQHKPAEDVARDLLERALALASLQQIQSRLEPFARRAGYENEQDILDDIS